MSFCSITNRRLPFSAGHGYRKIGGNSSHSVSLAYALHEPPKYEQDTQQLPIIMLHGLFGSKQNNRSISKALARDLKTNVFALDLRNHGDSPQDPCHDYTSMALDVKDFMDAHGLGVSNLIGHSMGAKTAMTLALRSPGRVGALIAVDNAPVDTALGKGFVNHVQGMLAILRAGVKSQADADRILKEYEDSLPIRQFLLTNLLRNPDSGSLEFRIPIHILGKALDNMGDFPIKDAKTIQYSGPTLIIRGTKSHYVPNEVLPLMGQFFPRFEVLDIDSGHWVISEKPEAFRQAVVKFLRTRD